MAEISGNPRVIGDTGDWGFRLWGRGGGDQTPSDICHGIAPPQVSGGGCYKAHLCRDRVGSCGGGSGREFINSNLGFPVPIEGRRPKSQMMPQPPKVPVLIITEPKATSRTRLAATNSRPYT